MANIGDIVPRSGIFTEPGVVVEKKEGAGGVVVDTDPMAINKFHRYANTTGLTELEKNTFNGILDEIYKHTDDISKINDIQLQIDKLKINPENKNVVRYLRNQQAFLVRQAKGLPRMYQTDDSKVSSAPK